MGQKLSGDRYTNPFLTDEMKARYLIQGFCQGTIPGEIGRMIATFTWEQNSRELIKKYEFRHTEFKGTDLQTSELYRIRDSKFGMIKEIYLKGRGQRFRENVDYQLLQLSRQQHPNILELLDCFMDVDHQNLFLIYECFKVELTDLIIENGNIQERFAKVLFQQLLSAIVYLHEKDIVHGDIKPETLLVETYELGVDMQLKLMFIPEHTPPGVSMEKLNSGESDWSNLLKMTSPYCVAPEMLKHHRADCERTSDHWN